MATPGSERIGGAPTAFRLAQDRDSRERVVALEAEQRVISADSHVIEPGDLWTTHITKKFRDRAPHIESRATMPDGTVEDGQFLVIEGSGPQRVAGFAAMDVDPKERKSANTRGYDQIRAGGWDPVERLKDQDIDGVSAEVIYPSMTMPYFSLEDAGFQQAVFAAYTTWLSEFVADAPERLVGLALLCLDDIDWAVAELHRARRLGLRGALIPNDVGPDRTYADPLFDPVWAAAAELEMPLSMHILTGRQTRPAGPKGDPWFVWYMSLPSPAMRSITAMLCGGVFARYPTLKVVSVENDIGWLGHYLFRLQHAWDQFRYLQGYKDPLSPIEYFAQNIWATFQSDPVGVDTRERIGIDRLMWGSDYPHGDSTWPASRETIDWNFQTVGPDDVAKMTHDNVRALYGLG